MSAPKAGSRGHTPDTTATSADLHRRSAAALDRRDHGAPDHGHAVEPPRSNLRLSRTPLIGRDHEIAAVQRLLLENEAGLLTLTGPGGIGKTRLALQVAAGLLDHFLHGVYFVSLAPITEPPLVIAAIAQTFDVRDTGARDLLQGLQDFLRERQLLLVLDNFEQVVAAAPLVANLLPECPRLKLLVTSRATLHLYGEQEYPVPPLALPDLKRLNAMGSELVPGLEQVAAVALFVQRAQAVNPNFVLTAANARAVAEICRALDGLPLALELAAAKIKLLSPAALLSRLQQRLTLLTGGPHDLPPRQRTLRAEIDWSYKLLAPGEQALFRRLAVFAGGWTLEAAEAMGYAPQASSAELEVLEVLGRLVNHSLVVADEEEGSTRYHLLESILHYAHEKLVEMGEAAEAHERHLAYYLEFAEAGEPHTQGPHQVRQLDQYAVEHDNFRAALQWGAKDNADAALRLAGTLAEFWARRGYSTEGRAWLQTLLDQVSALPELQGEAARRRLAAQAKALLGLSTMAFVAGEIAATLAGREASVRLYRQVEDRQGLAKALGMLGYAAMLRGDTVEAERALAEAIALGRESADRHSLSFALGMQSRLVLATRGDLAAARASSAESARLARETGMPWATAQAVLVLARVAAHACQWDEARAHIREGLALFHQLGDRYRFNATYSDLAHIERRAGNLEEAGRIYQETIVVWQELGQRAAIAHQLESFAFLARAQNQLVRAARLLGAAEALRAALDSPMNPSEQAEYDQEVTALYAQMGVEIAAAHWAAGRIMTMEEAIAYVLAAEEFAAAGPTQAAPDPAAPPPTYPAGLTSREVEVLRLLAHGLTYAQIAEQLIISRRTVNAHVISIYSKLDVHTRSAATRFAFDHHLISR
jgi:predicted ATPase/DNA-binding CsgD family transcriptional regulator